MDYLGHVDAPARGGASFGEGVLSNNAMHQNQSTAMFSGINNALFRDRFDRHAISLSNASQIHVSNTVHDAGHIRAGKKQHPAGEVHSVR